MRVNFWLKIYDDQGEPLHEELMELHSTEEENGFDLGFGPLALEHDVMLPDGGRVSVSVEED